MRIIWTSGCSLIAMARWPQPTTKVHTPRRGIPLFPSPIAESLGALIITAILPVYGRKKDRKLNSMLLLYAPLRFVLELFRENSTRGMIGIFATPQTISIAIAAAAAAYWEEEDLQLKSALPPPP